MGKWTPNEAYEGLLETLDPNIEGGNACEKLSLLDRAPQARKNRTDALICNPEMRYFAFGFGWPTKRTLKDLQLDLLES